MTVDDFLAKMNLYSDEQDYVLVQLPVAAIVAAAGVVAEVGEPFCALLVDKDEVSLMLPAEALEDFGGRLQGHKVAETRYRLLTLDVATEPNLVGFMARVSGALAEAGVSVFPYAAYTRDHIFVPAEQFDTARKTLEQL